ncbi:MAG: U32 family peptidase C-terminal domain-containing protein [Acidobacteriota bacterium]|nr:U32 family peptidase C-terminal domain-containing protein [Acidobacteriota bacterium]
MFRPEILAPAGNLFKLKTAVRYGADAVYIAGKRFGLRSAAENFTHAEIAEGCRFAHAAGARVYVVLNAFLFDDELAELPPFLDVLAEAGVDAVIVSDLGVVETVRRHGRLTIHLSTQASALSTAAARFWQARGVKRLVLGREVGIQQAAAIKQNTGVEVELFVHGAMCMAFSGNCTISNYTAGRDSNRGGCIQSCRFRYSVSEQRGEADGPSGYFLSSKDLQGVAQLDRFIDGEIDSLKIEGRMKSPLYVATTVRAYRMARDAAMAGKRTELDALFAELDTMSHRDYTTANLIHKAGSDSVYNHPDGHIPNTHDMLGHVVDTAPGDYLAVFVKNPLTAGEPIELLARDGRNIVLDTSHLKDIRGREAARINPNRVVLLPYHPDAEKDLLVRKPKDETGRNTALTA